MTWLSRFGLSCVPCWLCIASLAVLAATAQAQAVPTRQDPVKDAPKDTTSHLTSVNVAGNWQVSWTVRLGTEPCVLHLEQDGAKLTGTFKDLHGISPLTGNIDQKQLSFDVRFGGKRPFTTRFTGTANGDKMEGKSEAVNVSDGGGAFLGHGGEILQPDHPWTAKRAADQPSPVTQTSSTSNTTAKN